MFNWIKKIEFQGWLLFAVVIGKLYDIFISPIVNINIERWAESKDYDDELVDGGQQVKQVLIALLEWIDWALEFLTNPYFIGFVAGTFGLAAFQILRLRFRSRNNDSKIVAPQKKSPKAISFNTSNLENAELENYSISPRDDFDLIPLNLIVRCKRSDDGLDIRGIIQFRNRGAKPVFISIISVEFSLDDELAKCSGLSTPISPETSQSANFQPLRVYDENDHGGYAVLVLKFGLSTDTMRTVLMAQYNFKILTYAPNKSTDFVCDLDVEKTIQYQTEVKF